jgi:hypothetical protein
MAGARKGVSRSRITVLALTACHCISGCLPCVLPPGQVAANVGAAAPQHAVDVSEPPDYDAIDPATTTGEAIYDLRASFNPIQLFPSQQERVFDVGLGYFIEDDHGFATPIQGPYSQFDYYFFKRVTHVGVQRFGVRTAGELIYFDPSSNPDFGGSFGLVAEIGTFASGLAAAADSKGLIAAVGHGELAIGAYAGLAYRALRSEGYWLPSVGIYARVPAALGVLCCFDVFN